MTNKDFVNAFCEIEARRKEWITLSKQVDVAIDNIRELLREGE